MHSIKCVKYKPAEKLALTCSGSIQSHSRKGCAYERRAIFGLMAGNEGKTAVPILKTLRDAGFNPKGDMLMVNVLHLKYAGANEGPFCDVKLPGINGPNMRDTAFGGYGGIIVDWDMRSSFEGLYAAGNQLAGIGGASFSGATGRYSGRTAVTWAKGQQNIAPSEAQISAEKKRVYSYVQARLDTAGKTRQPVKSAESNTAIWMNHKQISKIADCDFPGEHRKYSQIR